MTIPSFHIAVKISKDCSAGLFASDEVIFESSQYECGLYHVLTYATVLQALPQSSLSAPHASYFQMLFILLVPFFLLPFLG
jgi:hypothetical protein